MDRYIIKGKVFKPSISKDVIAERVRHIANRINDDYAGREPLFLIVLKGSIFFAADLLRNIELNCTIDTISAKSYGQRMESSGRVIIDGEAIDYSQKDIIIIEDIIDTGYTMDALVKHLKSVNPKSIEIAAFLSKPDLRKVDIEVKYLGFEIPPKFVIGYGLDYAEQGRQLPDIYALAEYGG